MAATKKNGARVGAKAHKNSNGSVGNSAELPVHHARGRIITIETIRVILTLWVVQHHFLVTYMNEDWKEHILGNFFGTISRGLSRNNQAVPYAFIAISGFMTHWTTRHVSFSLSNLDEMAAFVRRRVTRVFLAHFVTCVVAIIMLWPSFVGESPNSATSSKTIPEHLWRSWPSLLGLQAWFAMVDADFTFVHTLYPNFAAWTVSSLMFCWVIYPVYTRILVNKDNVAMCIGGILYWSAFMYVCFTLFPGEEDENSTRSGKFQGFFWFPTMVIPQFAVGIYYAELAAIVYKSTTMNTTLRLVLSGVGFLAFFTYMWLNMYDTDVTLGGAGFQYVGWFRMHLVMVAVFLSAIGAEAGVFGTILCWPIYSLGEYTLHIYLWQAAAFRAGYAYFHGGLVNWPVFFDVYAFTCTFIGCILFSIFYVEIVEKRLIAGRLRRRVDLNGHRIIIDAKKGA